MLVLKSTTNIEPNDIKKKAEEYLKSDDEDGKKKREIVEL